MATDRLTWNYTSPSIRFVLEADYIGQSIEGNYSILDCWIKCVNVGGPSTFSNNTGNHWGSVDGVGQFGHHYASPWLPSGYATNAIRWRKGGTVNVPHNADGSRGPAVVRMRVAYGRSAGNIDNTDTYSISLPTIPRATTPEFRISGTPVTEFDAGVSNLVINLPRASSNFTHDVTYNFQGETGTIATGAGVTASWVPPLALLNKIPNALQGTGSITVVTKSGSTTIGSKTLSFTLKVPASVVPTISSITLDDLNTLVKSQIGGYVKGQSILKATVNAAGVYSSTIQESSFSVDGSTAESGGSISLGTSGTRSVGASAKDSRQKIVTASTSISVLDYSDPKINNYVVMRTNASGVAQSDGSYLKITLNCSVSSLIVGTQKNSHTIQVFTRARGTTLWVARNVISLGTTLTYNNSVLVQGGGIFAPSTAWEVRVDVSDKLKTESDTFVISTASAVVDATATKQAFGKLVEDSGPATQIQGPARVYGGLDVDGTSVVLVSDRSNNAETQAGTSTTKLVTPASLTTRTATESRTGLAELVTQAEADAGTDLTRIMTSGRVRNLAYRAWASASGVASVSASGDPTTITFPPGRFTQPPHVFAVPHNSGGLVAVVYQPADQITSSQFKVSLWSLGASRIAGSVRWYAVQMTSGAASG